jgi:putative ABC transport system ATP-binding protein
MMELDGVSKTYYVGSQEVRALEQVHAQLRQGEVLGVFGPSGSGKTTFLMMAGLVDVPTAGRIIFKGNVVASPQTEMRQLRAFRRRNIGFVFQRANLIPFLTAVENVQVAMYVSDWPKVKAEYRAGHLLNSLGLENRKNSYAQQLSGGEQQRVAIARALANRPVMLFADEPTAALDSVKGREVIQLFKLMAKDHGMSVCVVTHDPRWIELFDVVIEMSDGRIVKSYRLTAGESRDYADRTIASGASAISTSRTRRDV